MRKLLVKITPQNLSRTGAGICLLLVLLASLWGRTLQRILEGNKLVFLGLGVFTLATLLSWLFSHYRIDNRKHLLKSLPLILLSALVMIAIVELSIVAAIERIHFIKYGALTVFLYFSTDGPRDFRRWFNAAGASAAIGASEECLQYFHPERVFDLRDIWLNMAGCLFGSASIALILVCAKALKPIEVDAFSKPN
jgi:hypothetical protein